MRSVSVVIGMTLRLTEMRGVALVAGLEPGGAVQRDLLGLQVAERHAGVLADSVELWRFMPCCAAQTAVARVPAPHQIRSGRPGDCGWIAQHRRRVRAPGVGARDAAPAIAARKSAVRARAESASVSPSAGT